MDPDKVNAVSTTGDTPLHRACCWVLKHSLSHSLTQSTHGPSSPPTERYLPSTPESSLCSRPRATHHEQTLQQPPNAKEQGDTLLKRGGWPLSAAAGLPQDRCDPDRVRRGHHPSESLGENSSVGGSLPLSRAALLGAS